MFQPHTYSCMFNPSSVCYVVCDVVFQAVYVAIVTIAASQEGSSESPAKLLSNSKKFLAQFKCLLAKYVKSKQVQLICHVLSELYLALKWLLSILLLFPIRNSNLESCFWLDIRVQWNLIFKSIKSHRVVLKGREVKLKSSIKGFYCDIC